jgi:hypothetical protein
VRCDPSVSEGGANDGSWRGDALMDISDLVAMLEDSEKKAA